jgi:hypothetical protein
MSSLSIAGVVEANMDDSGVHLSLPVVLRGDDGKSVCTDTLVLTIPLGRVFEKREMTLGEDTPCPSSAQ